jgi:hypothetical protein
MCIINTILEVKENWVSPTPNETLLCLGNFSILQYKVEDFYFNPFLKGILLLLNMWDCEKNSMVDLGRLKLSSWDEH